MDEGCYMLQCCANELHIFFSMNVHQYSGKITEMLRIVV